MAYTIYILPEGQMTISGGGQLDGVTQGDGRHLVGKTITLDSRAWQPVVINDDDANFQDNDGSQRLASPTTIDGVTFNANAVVEAEYSLQVTDGTSTWTVVGFNVNNSNPSYGTVEALAFVGGPGGFPPSGVPLTVVSNKEGPNFAAANYATPLCFVRGTLIGTPTGPRPVEDIRTGDLVTTMDNGPMPVVWRSARVWPAVAPFAPVLFRPGAIGNARPSRLSPQHRLHLSGWRVELHCGSDEALAPACHFVNGRDVVFETGGEVEYHHLMFDQHQIIFAEGVAAESFHPGATALNALDQAARDELLTLFPELLGEEPGFGGLARPALRASETRICRAA